MKIYFGLMMCLIPLMFMLGGTVEKGIRRYGIPSIIFIYMCIVHSFSFFYLIPFGASVGLLSMGYGDKAVLSIMPAANKGRWYGYLGVFMLGCFYCSVNWLYHLNHAITWQNIKLVALAWAGMTSLFAFVIHKYVNGRTDRWTIWEVLGGGLAFSIGFATIG